MKKLFLLLLSIAVILGGCTNNLGGDTDANSATKNEQRDTETLDVGGALDNGGASELREDTPLEGDNTNDSENLENQDDKDAQTPPLTPEIGVVEIPIEPFAKLSFPEHEGYAFEENGLFGFKDGYGNTIVEPRFTSANAYFRNALANARITTIVDGEEVHDSFYISPTGAVMQARYIARFSEALLLDGVETALFLCRQEDLWGVVNADFDIVIPIEYDFVSYDHIEGKTYGVKGGDVHLFDFHNMKIVSYSPYDDMKSDYDRLLEMPEKLPFLIEENVVGGEPHEFALGLVPLNEHNLYYKNDYVTSAYPQIFDSAYGNLVAGFDDYRYQKSEGLVAIPKELDGGAVIMHDETDFSSYGALVDQYIVDKGFSNTPYEIIEVKTGDMQGAGVPSALVSFATTYDEVSDEIDLNEVDLSETTLFSVILFVPDVTNLTQYLPLLEYERFEERLLDTPNHYVLHVNKSAGVFVKSYYYEHAKFEVISLENLK